MLKLNCVLSSTYRKNYGPKGYGYGVGSGTLSMDDGQGYKTNPNQVDHRAQAYVAPLKKPLVQSNTENTEVSASKPAGEMIVSKPADNMIASKPAVGNMITSKPLGKMIASKPASKMIASKSAAGKMIASKPVGKMMANMPTGTVIASTPECKWIARQPPQISQQLLYNTSKTIYFIFSFAFKYLLKSLN